MRELLTVRKKEQNCKYDVTGFVPGYGVSAFPANPFVLYSRGFDMVNTNVLRVNVSPLICCCGRQEEYRRG